MFHAVRVLSLASSLVLSAAIAEGTEKVKKPGSAAGPSALPRYRLEVGQQLDYEGNTTHKFEQLRESRHSTDWRFVVVAANEDGSWRIIVRETVWRASGKQAVSKDAHPAHSTMAYFDLYADGRIVGKSSLASKSITRVIGAGPMGTGRTGPMPIDVRKLFPRLPDDHQELVAGWSDEGSEKSHHYQIASKEDTQTQIRDAETWPTHDVFLMTVETKYNFDLRRGIVDRVSVAYSRGLGAKVDVTGEIKLIGTEPQTGESVSTLGDEVPGYFAAVDDYLKRIKQAEKDADRSEQFCAEAKGRLQHEASNLTAPMLKSQAAAILSDHEATKKHAVQVANQRAEVVGMVAADFETTDLDDHPFSLNALRGKVVVLDFWFRGCEPCIAAMPQINETARSFKGRPVAVVGMNIDAEIDDARFVVEKMGLEYANVKAEGLPERFHVKAFPTLVVLDQQGIVRDFHVGYSPTLLSELTEMISTLLAER